jgi:glycerol-3-phosphate dehydrogenase
MDGYDVHGDWRRALGCFTARALTRYRLKTALLEAREDVCTGVSRANTAIVYSGCDTRPGTLKSRMCVRAAQSFAELCRTLGVRYSPCGSLMICFGPNAEKTLRGKYAQGLETARGACACCRPGRFWNLSRT